MKSVKFSLLNFHFWSCFLDFGLSILSTPYVFAPALAGYPLGILSYLGVSGAEQTYVWLTVMTVVTVSIIGLFENRFNILLNNSRCWRHVRKLMYLINHTTAISCFLITYVLTPDQEMACNYMRSQLVCIPPYADQSRIFIFTIYIGRVLKPGFVCFSWFYLQIFMFPILSNRVLSQKLRYKMSENTARIQKTFQKALLFQVALPVIILAFPICYLALATALWYHNQALNNISFIIISSHGFFSTISMIALHSVYRNFTLNFVCYRFGVQYKSNAQTAHRMNPSVIT